MTTIHYAAAHVALPALLFTDRQLVTQWLTGPHQRGFLCHTVWGVAAACSEGDVVRPSRFTAWTERAGVAPVIVVRFPGPSERGEAHAAVIVPPQESWVPWLRREARYFTLEHAAALDDRPGPRRTMIGEWTRDRQHINYGPGPRPSDKDGFLHEVGEILTGERKPLTRTRLPIDERVDNAIQRALQSAA